jgi:hypothetical protein
MAYEARVVRDRIRSAIRQIEHAANHSDQVRDANLRLLDALDRLDAVDGRFQERSRRRRDTSGNEATARWDGRSAGSR